MEFILSALFCVCLASVVQHMSEVHSFLVHSPTSFLNGVSIPLYKQATFHGCLGCLQFVAIIKKVATNTLTLKTFWWMYALISVTYILRSESLGYRVYTYPAFVGIAQQFSKVIIPIYTSMSNV